MSIHLKQLEDAPRSLVGAPHPTVLATEHRVVLLYYTADDYDKAVIVFDHCFEYRMGMPSEGLVSRHALYDSGLRAWDAFEVIGSPWLQELEARYGVVSKYSRSERQYRHYFFTFHDRSFECVASAYRVTTIKDDREISVLVGELPSFLADPTASSALGPARDGARGSTSRSTSSAPGGSA